MLRILTRLDHEPHQQGGSVLGYYPKHQWSFAFVDLGPPERPGAWRHPHCQEKQIRTHRPGDPIGGYKHNVPFDPFLEPPDRIALEALARETWKTSAKQRQQAWVEQEASVKAAQAKTATAATLSHAKALATTCPTCQAGPSEPCVQLTSRQPKSALHQSRTSTVAALLPHVHVACPTCDAVPYQPCRRPDSRQLQRMHRRREVALIMNPKPKE